jgi:glutamate synthase domain-containing protein 3
MSGGIAYVLDERGDFAEKRCNRSGVDLEPVMETADIELLRGLIAKHFEYTGSPRAEWILDNWGTMLPKFVKVFPHEFKRVLGIKREVRSQESEVRMPAVRAERTGAIAF